MQVGKQEVPVLAEEDKDEKYLSKFDQELIVLDAQKEDDIDHSRRQFLKITPLPLPPEEKKRVTMSNNLYRINAQEEDYRRNPYIGNINLRKRKSKQSKGE